MTSKPPIVLASVEARIADCERDIVKAEGLQELKALELAAIDFYLQMKQTYLIRLQAEKAQNKSEEARL